MKKKPEEKKNRDPRSSSAVYKEMMVEGLQGMIDNAKGKGSSSKSSSKSRSAVKKGKK